MYQKMEIKMNDNSYAAESSKLSINRCRLAHCAVHVVVNKGAGAVCCFLTSLSPRGES